MGSNGKERDRGCWLARAMSSTGDDRLSKRIDRCTVLTVDETEQIDIGELHVLGDRDR